jgi:hypothetical protein
VMSRSFNVFPSPQRITTISRMQTKNTKNKDYGVKRPLLPVR